MKDCNCLACENGLGSALTRIISSFGGNQAKNKIAASYGVELEAADIEEHCEANDITDTALPLALELDTAHRAIDLHEITPEHWGLSLDRGEEALKFLQNKLFALALMQLEIVESQKRQCIKGESDLPPSEAQSRILDRDLRNLDRYTGISLIALQQKAVRVVEAMGQETQEQAPQTRDTAQVITSEQSTQMNTEE